MAQTGAIRWIPEAPGCTIVVKPTYSQIRSILRGWKESPRRRNGLGVDIVDKDGSNIISEILETPDQQEIEALINEYM